MKLHMRIVEIKHKSLASGDVSTRVVLETLYAEDVVKLAALTGKQEIIVTFDESQTK